MDIAPSPMRETSSPPSEMCFTAMCLRSRIVDVIAVATTPGSGHVRLRFLVGERGGQVAEGVDLLLQVGDLLLDLRDRVGAGDEAARRLLLGRDGQQRLRELGRVAGLLAVLRLPPRALLRAAVSVVVDRRRSVVRRLVREQLGAEEPRVDDGGGD